MEKTEKTYKERIADVLKRRAELCDDGARPLVWPNKESEDAKRLVRDCVAHAGREWENDAAGAVAWLINDVPCEIQGGRPEFWLERCANRADLTKARGPQPDLPPSKLDEGQ